MSIVQSERKRKPSVRRKKKLRLWKEETLAEIRKDFREERDEDRQPGEWHSGLTPYRSRARRFK